ncbi:MAG: hypothetical protein NZ839_00625, partial [Endomicrobia bacterium]|nr:hypothetical protein [Endomicrobiia bacterium]
TKNKFYAGDKFFEIVCNLRYPVSYKRICSLKQFKKQNLEFDETLIENFPQKLKHLLHKI